MRKEIEIIIIRIIEVIKEFFRMKDSPYKSYKLEEQNLIEEYENKLKIHNRTENHSLKVEDIKMDEIDNVITDFERKGFNETAIILTEMEEGPVQVNIAQMREVLGCMCRLMYSWTDEQKLDFIKRYGAPK